MLWTILVILLILFLCGAVGGWHYGGPYVGAPIGLIILLLLVIWLFGYR